jgi:type IV pilus assembly protein PilW
MVAVALGMLIVAGMLALVALNSSNRAELDKAGRQIENGRFAIQKLSEDIQNAGYFGDYYSAPRPGQAGFPTALLLPAACSTTATVLATAASFPVQGYANVSTTDRSSLLPCIPEADFLPGSNVLVVRFASPVAALTDGWSSSSPLENDVMYLQANVSDIVFGTKAQAANFTLQNNTAASLAAAPVHRLVTRIYFVGNCGRFAAGQTSCTSAADGGLPVPSLRMVEMGAGSAGAGAAFSSRSVAIAEGIEVLEFDYGIDADGDGAVSSLSRTPTVDQFGNVLAVRVSLIARNSEPTAGYVDDKVYVVGSRYPVGTEFNPAAKNFKRHQFQATVRVVNAALRRDQ